MKTKPSKSSRPNSMRPLSSILIDEPERAAVRAMLYPVGLLLFAALILATFHVSAKDLTNQPFGFQVSIPDSFHEIPVGNKEPDTLCKFVNHDPNPSDPSTAIQIQRLRGTINPHRRLKLEEVPKIAGLSTTLEEAAWSTLSLDVMRQVMSLPNQTKFVVYGIQFPLSDEAVQLQVGGPIANDEEVHALFKTVVASFKNTKPLAGSFPGPSGRMLTKEERISKLSSGIARMVITVVVVSFVVITILRSRRKKNPPKIEQH